MSDLWVSGYKGRQGGAAESIQRIRKKADRWDAVRTDSPEMEQE
jgi:hypothetical protein